MRQAARITNIWRKKIMVPGGESGETGVLDVQDHRITSPHVPHRHRHFGAAHTAALAGAYCFTNSACCGSALITSATFARYLFMKSFTSRGSSCATWCQVSGSMCCPIITEIHESMVNSSPSRL